MSEETGKRARRAAIARLDKKGRKLLQDMRWEQEKYAKRCADILQRHRQVMEKLRLLHRQKIRDIAAAVEEFNKDFGE